jgi:hypothetical protein
MEILVQKPDYAVIKRGNIEDEQTGEAYEVFEFRTVAGRIRQIRIPRAQSRNTFSVYKELLKLNADLPLFQAASVAVVQRAIDTEASARLVYAKALGWRARCKGFVFANESIGGAAIKRRVLPPVWASDLGSAGSSCRGTLADWRNVVAKPAAASDGLTLAITACLAAPLLKVVNQANFGINLFGLALEDRAVVASVAASVLGISDDWALLVGEVRSASRSTHGARAFNDLLLFAGDDSECRSAAGHRRWRRGVKSLSAGHKQSDSGAAGWASNWRGTFLTTTQNSNEHWAVVLGEGRTRDDRATWIDVPSGPAGLFTPSASALRQPREEPTWEQLKDACANQHGTAIRAYISALIRRRDHLQHIVQKYCNAFVTAASADRRFDNRYALIARNFGLMHAAGRLAIEAGILPWKRRHLHDVLQRRLAAVIAHLRSFQVTPQAIRRILRRRLCSSAVVQRTYGMHLAPSKSGFWHKVDDEIVFTIRAKAFRRWFGDVSYARSALLWLHESGLLRLGKRHVLVSAKSTDWAERTPRWPDGSVQRSFVFTAPQSIGKQIQEAVKLAGRRASSSRAVLKPKPLFAGVPDPTGRPPSRRTVHPLRRRPLARGPKARTSMAATAVDDEEPSAPARFVHIVSGPLCRDM